MSMKVVDIKYILQKAIIVCIYHFMLPTHPSIVLYMQCVHRLDRGKQKLVMGCEMYCKDYVFAYPKHLKNGRKI